MSFGATNCPTALAAAGGDSPRRAPLTSKGYDHAAPLVELVGLIRGSAPRQHGVKRI
jgi:hypothetical protein